VNEAKLSFSVQGRDVRNCILVTVGLIFAITFTSCNLDEMPANVLTVNGDTMLPSYQPKTSFGIDEAIYSSEYPYRGDIIVYNVPQTGSIGLGRIVGLPNEQIDLKRGLVHVDGNELFEPYIDVAPTSEYEQTIQLGDDEFFIIVDNRNELYADRAVIHFDSLIGKAIMTCKPGLIIMCDEIETVAYEN
jgi:signal peptidase I